MGSLSESKVGEPPLSCHNPPLEPFQSSQSIACNALKLAINYSLERSEPDGHWVGELKYNSLEKFSGRQHHSDKKSDITLELM